MTANSILLLPGMGADARMFRPQQLALPELQVAEWIPPESRETIAHYAERMAQRVTLLPDSCLGGASFGGVVALEMAALVPVKKCLLIGSLRSPTGLRWIYPRLRCLGGLSSFGPRSARAGLGMAGTFCGSTVRGILRQVADADGQFLSWAVRALLEWSPSPSIANLSIAQIHGQRDWLLPARLSQADVIVPGAGHLLSLTHWRVVNDFLEAHMANSAR